MRRYLGGESTQISAVTIDIQRSGLLTDILLEVPLQFFIPGYLGLHLVALLLHDVPHPPDLLVLVSQINLNVVLHQINPLPELSGFQIVNNDIFWLFEHLNGMIDLISAQHKFIIFIIKIVKLLNKLLLIEVSVLQTTLEPLKSVLQICDGKVADLLSLRLQLSRVSLHLSRLYQLQCFPPHFLRCLPGGLGARRVWVRGKIRNESFIFYFLATSRLEADQSAWEKGAVGGEARAAIINYSSLSTGVSSTLAELSLQLYSV